MATRSSADATTNPESSVLGDTSCGAVWRKVDLHLHSPGVDSFRCPNGADIQTEAGRQKIIETYVRQMRDAHIQVGAITDYNGIRQHWFIPIREQARKYGITLLPGVEISFSVGRGLHVLAVFDQATDIEQVNSFLLTLDHDGARPLFTPNRKHRDIEPKEHVADTLKRLCERFGCLLIFPHPDQPNGLCKSFQPVEAAKLLKEISPDALEHCPDAEVRKLQSTGVLSSKFLERLSLVEFSDPKCIEDIGTKRRVDGGLRATYLKLSAIGIEALRLALHDPENGRRRGSVPAAGGKIWRTTSTVMNLSELYERIARWEDLHTEFKEWPVHPDDLAASLVAFANTDGGQLIFGVSNNRLIVGVGDSDRVTRDVDNVAVNNCDSPITVIQEVLYPSTPPHDRPVVVINIPKGDMRPYRTNRRVYYIRTTSGRRQASREELLRLFQATESLYYDETPLPRLSLTDLDLDALDRYIEATGQEELESNRERLLMNWGLFVRDHPTIAGIILFGREPQRHLPFAQINAARFPGTESSVEPSDRKDLTGRLLDVIDQAERFLDLHLRIPHTIHGFEPEPRPELPKEALREAIVNAVAHRDYTVHGPVRLFIFDDRIEVHTPGRPPNTVDEEAMRAGVHVVRNPRIYTRLSDAGLVTRAGTGVRRIIRLVREATGKDIGITIRAFEVLLTIPRRDPV